MKKKFLQAIALSTLLLLLAAGCAREQLPAKAEGTFHIVTSFYPMYVATLNITKGIDGVKVVNMTKPQTGCLHDYQLTPEDMKKLEQADAFVVNGAGMEAFLDKAAARQKDMKIIEASKDIELLQEGDEPNPHVWVSITAAMQQVDNIARQLSAADPKHAEQYKKNAEAYNQKLTALKNEMHAAIDPLPNKNIVTFHEAFPYFAKEFHLNTVAVIEREPGSEPTPQELEATVAVIKDRGVIALFAEPQYPAEAAQTIAKESGARIYTLDPVVTGEADENAADAYIIAMKKNMQVLKEALQ